ncbi:MAG: excinuclease ABC subunit UvrC [Bacteroidales bacterium]|nr:excinuclease ABC subunit UvrC [Bacteroidales bacterium]
MKVINPHYQKLEPIIRALDDNPGVYQFFDEDAKILYVGKAKNLKKRVSSYFNKDKSMSGKLRVLVKKIADIKFIIVDNEFDAFLLENNLIKKYQPRYNVMLKDDKTYPWLCVKNEPFPRIFPTRHVIKDGSLYFGPYASVKMMNTLLDLIRQLYPLRTCRHNLSEENIRKKKYKICLEYHLGNCLAPCEGLQSAEEYDDVLSVIKDIIKGNIHSVGQTLKKHMSEYAKNMEFEKAQIVKEKIELLDRYRSKSTIVNPRINNVDVFSFASDEQFAYVNFLKVVNGAIVQAHTIELKKKLEESPEELLGIAITDFRQRFKSDAKEIITPFTMDVEIPDVLITIPQRGDKKMLLDLSERNAKYYKLEKQKRKNLVDPLRHSKRILEQMKKDLRLKVQPDHIECFDNSNIQGDFPVAAMVVFRNARPFKKEYRHYNIKTVEGANDYASMEEIVYRRYKRLLSEKSLLPQLIVVDGGKGQLNAALSALSRLDLRGKVAIIGIAKRLEEIYYPGDSIPLYLDKKSETLKVIQHLRNEAHRFGITHHRKKREKETIKSVLTKVEGIGSSSSQALLSKFRSVKNIKNAKLEDLQEVVGKAKGRLVFDHFNKM